MLVPGPNVTSIVVDRVTRALRQGLLTVVGTRLATVVRIGLDGPG